MIMKLIPFEGFIWDIHNLYKIAKHGVSKEEVESIFTPRLYIFEDGRHSWSEERLIGIGQNNLERYIFVSYTHKKLSELIFIRVITARYMHKKERWRYENYQK